MTFKRCSFFIGEIKLLFPGEFCTILKEGGILILLAKKANGMLLTITSTCSREDLRRLRSREIFRCPQCNQPVILKIGQLVTPHFAHKQNKLCTAQFSEGESEAHLQGKEQLYHFFSHHLPKVQLEPYISALAQRPDILLEIDKQKIPIEFQCSPIPISQVQARTAGYIKASMKPIWILYCPSKYHQLSVSVHRFRLTKFEQHFIIQDREQHHHLLTYNPKNRSFHYFAHLLYITGNQFIGMHRTLSSSAQSFPFVMPIQPTKKELQQYVVLYEQQRQKFLHSRIYTNQQGIRHLFLKAAYELRLHWASLPNWIGIPVEKINSFNSHPAEWQLLWLQYMHQLDRSPTDVTPFIMKKFLEKQEGNFACLLQALTNYVLFLQQNHIHSIRNEQSLSPHIMEEQFKKILWNK